MPTAISTAVNSVAEKGCSLTQGACRNTGSTTMAAAKRGTARVQDRSGAVSCQVPPIKSVRQQESLETLEDISWPCA